MTLGKFFELDTGRGTPIQEFDPEHIPLVKEILNFDKDSGPSQVIKQLAISTIIKFVTIIVETAFDPGFTISVGFPLNPIEIVATTDCDLTETNKYLFDVYRTSAGIETMIAYFAGVSAGGAGKVIVESY